MTRQTVYEIITNTRNKSEQLVFVLNHLKDLPKCNRIWSVRTVRNFYMKNNRQNAHYNNFKTMINAELSVRYTHGTIAD